MHCSIFRPQVYERIYNVDLNVFLINKPPRSHSSTCVLHVDSKHIKSKHCILKHSLTSRHSEDKIQRYCYDLNITSGWTYCLNPYVGLRLSENKCRKNSQQFQSRENNLQAKNVTYWFIFSSLSTFCCSCLFCSVQILTRFSRPSTYSCFFRRLTFADTYNNASICKAIIRASTI